MRRGPRAAVMRTECPRGAVALAMIVAMVILQLVIVGVVVMGVRDLDAGAKRLDGSRAFYASATAANMAVRELVSGQDDDGDGAVGSVAGGVVAHGPAVNGAHAAVILAVSGQTDTLTATGSGGQCLQALSINVRTSSAAADPVAAYSANATPVQPASRVFTSGAWAVADTTSSLTARPSWLTIRNSPLATSATTRALVSLAQDASLWITKYSGGAWGSASLLTAGAGTSNTRVFASEFEYQSGNLMVVYRQGPAASLRYRTYSVASPSQQTLSLGLAASPTWMEMAAKPNSNEIILVVAAGSTLCAGVWNGSSWGNSTTLESALPTSGRPFHVAYSTHSGKAIVVWTATSGVPRYMTWDGSAWSSPGTLPAIAGGVPAGWVALAASPKSTSDEVLMACIGTNNQINVNNWTGSAWGSNLVVETAAAANTGPRVDVAFEPGGARGLVVWHKAAQSALLYRTWSSGAWSSRVTGPDVGSESLSIRLGRGYNSSEIMMLVRRKNAGASDYNVFSQTSTVSTHTTTITGPIGQSTGQSLPVPPAATANSNNITMSNGSTQVFAPGTYGTLTVASSCTLNFSAGTYIFSSWGLQDNNQLNFDTSVGPIDIIITSGGVTDHDQSTYTNSGGAPVQFDIVGGNLDIHDGSMSSGFDFIIYNGWADLHDRTSGAINIWALGSVSFHDNGTISTNSLSSGGPPICTAVLWTGGSPGSPIDLCAAMVPSGLTDPCSLAGNPAVGHPAVTSWAQVPPQ